MYGINFNPYNFVRSSHVFRRFFAWKMLPCQALSPAPSLEAWIQDGNFDNFPKTAVFVCCFIVSQLFLCKSFMLDPFRWKKHHHLTSQPAYGGLFDQGISHIIFHGLSAVFAGSIWGIYHIFWPPKQNYAKFLIRLRCTHYTSVTPPYCCSAYRKTPWNPCMLLVKYLNAPWSVLLGPLGQRDILSLCTNSIHHKLASGL